MRYYLIAFCVTVIFVLPWFAFNYPDELNSFADLLANKISYVATVVTHNPKTVAGLQSAYNVGVSQGTAKIRVLIVPGHEPDYGGAEYGSLKEREMTAELSRDLEQFLSADGHYQVFTSRDAGAWNPVFADYFKDHWGDIVSWEVAYKNEIIDLARLGEFKTVTPSIFHNKAPDEVAFRLYGIDKWSNDNDIDIVIHVHLNDYPRWNQNSPGKYEGFAIYVPEKQYYNSSTTRALAQTVFKRLAKYNPVSDFPGEQNGIVEDQDLIAVGSYNSVNAASMLIEYGYIYEPQFTDGDLRGLAMKDLAYQTYLGLQDFFDPTNAANLENSYDTLLLPHAWHSPMDAKRSSPAEVYALQTALVSGGLYPPPPRALHECPRTGKLGPCTQAALGLFQKRMNISGENGKVGPKTLDALNREFGVKTM